MDDIDAQISERFRAVAPLPEPVDDRRPAIRAAVRRRRRRARVAGAVLLAGLVAGAAGILGPSSGREVLTAGPPPGVEATEATVTVSGLAPLRVSRTTRPVEGFGSFGAIPLAGGAITGAVATTRADGAVVALVAVTASATTTAVEVRPEGGAQTMAEVVDGHALAIVVLPAKDPFLVLEVNALGAGAEVQGTARISPYLQDPLTCATNPELTEVTEPTASSARSGPLAEPTHVPHLDAHLAAPIPAACVR